MIKFLSVTIIVLIVTLIIFVLIAKKLFKQVKDLKLSLKNYEWARESLVEYIERKEGISGWEQKEKEKIKTDSQSVLNDVVNHNNKLYNNKASN